MLQELTIKPAAGKHAIEIMALAVEWARPITTDVIERVRKSYEESTALQEFLPRLETLKGVKVQVGNDGPTVIAEPDGLQLTQHRADGSAAWVVQIQPEVLSCSCMRYDRWDSIKPKALQVLVPIVEIAASQNFPIQAVGLQYQDAFRVETISPQAAAHRLFNKNSAFLNSHVWRMDGPWHIHQGWFSTEVDERITHNLLNVDLTAEAESCLIRINGQHRMLATDAKGNQSALITSSEISSALDKLHNDNKQVLWIRPRTTGHSITLG